MRLTPGLGQRLRMVTERLADCMDLFRNTKPSEAVIE